MARLGHPADLPPIFEGDGRPYGAIQRPVFAVVRKIVVLQVSGRHFEALQASLQTM